MITKELMSLHAESFSAYEHNFTEYTLRIRCAPDAFVQLLAFNGVANLRNGQFMHITDWESLPPQVLTELRNTTMTSYRRFLEGKMKPEADGSYVLKSVATEATVQAGGISIPNYQAAKRAATNVQHKQLL